MKTIIDAKVNDTHTHFYTWNYFNPVKREYGKGRWIRVSKDVFFKAIERSEGYEIVGNYRVYSHKSDI